MKNCMCLLLSALVFLSGCGTIIHGKYQTVPVSSDPIGATVKASSGQSCVCPCELNLLRNNEYVLVAQMEGHEPLQQNLGKDTSGWFWANIVLGGIIGGVIDKSSGSGDKLVPVRVHFDFHGGKVLGAKDKKSELTEMKTKLADTQPKCTRCKVSGGEDSKWHMIDGKLLCLDCYNKPKTKTCKNCDQQIGNLENAYTFNNNIVCRMCNEKLTKQASATK